MTAKKNNSGKKPTARGEKKIEKRWSVNMDYYSLSVDKLLNTFYSLSRKKRISQYQIFESFSNQLQNSNGAHCFLIGKSIE